MSRLLPRPVPCAGLPLSRVLVALGWRVPGSPRAAATPGQAAQAPLPAAVAASGAAAKVGPRLQGSRLFMETSEGLEGEHSPCSRSVHGVKAWC